jgi:hypothetical protein
MMIDGNNMQKKMDVVKSHPLVNNTKKFMKNQNFVVFIPCRIIINIDITNEKLP